MRTLLLLVMLFTGITRLPAQKSFKRTTLYAEIAGSGMTLSVNYERQLSNKPGFGFFAGFGLGGDETPVSIPLGIKYLLDLGNKKSFLETGAGVTIAEKDAFDGKFKPFQSNDFTGVFIPTVGYRHHTRYGLMYRINYTPFFSRERPIFYAFGISLGWRL
jgi:hypothetical protein